MTTASTRRSERKANGRPAQNGGYDSITMTDRRAMQRRSIVGPLDPDDIKKSSMVINDSECQLIPVEIEKDAEIGLVLGQIENDDWIFIDEVLPNGMIDMHGVLKEGDYLIQAGNYSLEGVSIPEALQLVERAYDEGRKTLAFVAARAQKPAAPRPPRANGTLKKEPSFSPPAYERNSRSGRARSFVEYENAEEEEPRPAPAPQPRSGAKHSQQRANGSADKY